MVNPTHFVVITSAAGVPDDIVVSISGQLGAFTQVAKANRLGPNAVELAVAGDGGLNLATVSEQLQTDINLTPAHNRAKSVLIADMDSTIIPVECIDELADFAGVKPQVAEITEMAMRGELDFEEAIDARVDLLKNLPVAALEQCYVERVSLNPGAKCLIETMNNRGATTALVSGGFTFFTNRVARKAGFAINQANELLIENGHLTGKVARPILGQQAKLEALERIVAKRKTSMADVIAVGDGANDIAMIRAAGLGVAFHAKPALKAVADAALDHSDLDALLALQGLPG